MSNYNSVFNFGGGQDRIGMAAYGNFVYTLFGNSISQINVTTGTVVTNNWAPNFDQVYQLCSMCILGNYMYISNQFNQNVAQIAINSDGSSSTVNKTWATHAQFQGALAMHGSGTYLYVSGSALAKVAINSDGTAGTITPSWLTGVYIQCIAINNNYLYVSTNQWDSVISQYPINANGSLGTRVKFITEGPYGIAPDNMYLNPRTFAFYGPNLYMSNWNNNQSLLANIFQLPIISGATDVSGTVNHTWGIGPRQIIGTVVINGSLYVLTPGNGAYPETGGANYNYHIFSYTLPPPPPTYLYSKIKINYSSIVNGNPVAGTVFEGYYKYQVSNSVIKEFYSSTDMSTNLIISSTDSFATGALALLGKTSCNVVTSNGIDTTGNNAGVFVKNLPFMNALFKSNPYVLLKPSGCVMFDNYGVVNANVLATSYFTNKYVMTNGNVYSNKNNSFFSFSNFTFNFSSISALPTENSLLPIDYTFFNTIKQIKYNAKYNGAVLLDSYFVFYLDSSNNYHMCAQYPTTEDKNVLLFSDSACDNFPNTGNFGNTLGTVNPDPTVTTIVAVSGNAATATVTTSAVSATGTPTVTATVTATGAITRVNLNALNSNICFSEGSIVSTDQGDIEIQHIDITYHTIRNNRIIALTETQSVDDYLVKIKKNAFGNVPTQDTETTGNHMIFNGLSMVRAKTLINGDTIEKIPYRGLPLYNILLEHHDTMLVNGLVCETLNPENPIAKYYMLMAQHPENKIEMENMWRKRTQEIIHSF